MVALARFRTPWSLSLLSILLLGGCFGDNSQKTSSSNNSGFEVKFLVGSALGHFCEEAAAKFNRTNPKLDDGQKFYLSCEEKGSGDVVTEVLFLAQQHQNGSLSTDAPEFPTLVSVDGEIYHSQLIYQMNQLFPGQNYIPAITDAPLLAFSPMVFMTSEDLSSGLEKVENPYQTLVDAKNHRELDGNAPQIPINYVHTAPTRSNSGLQTLVAQFASVSGKRPEELTIADVQQFQGQIQKIQSKITRYGKSTTSLAKAMVSNGPFWASVGSVYESSVIEANLEQQPGQKRFKAIYPQTTFTSNMRAILPKAPWVSDGEKAAAEQVIEYLRSPEIQEIATSLGLRPGIPGISLGAKFSTEFGVETNPRYDSYRPPNPEVVEEMLTSWQQFAKKSSQVAVVIDVSGSMQGQKLAAVQNTLLNYVENLGPKEQIALIAFSGEIRDPILVEGTPQGRDRAIEYIGGLRAVGGTRLYDSALFARNWLQKNLRQDAINAVLVLTDGEDSGSDISFNQLSQELETSNFSSDERISFFTVGYGNKGDFNPDILKQMAELNGGYYRQGDPETISTLMADLQVEF